MNDYKWEEADSNEAGVDPFFMFAWRRSLAGIWNVNLKKWEDARARKSHNESSFPGFLKKSKS